MPDDKLPPVFIPITLEPGSIVEPAAPVETPITEAVISESLAAQTRAVLSTLTPREEQVLRERFGIGEPTDATLEEVGQDFEVTRQRIREIEAKALRMLRARKEARERAAASSETDSDDADESDDD